MEFTFYKYQGTGNDFILIDNRFGFFPKAQSEFIALLCDRRFGVGADGLILLENHPTADFRMVYFNSDGKEGSMCGNGGRCVVHFANYLEIIDTEAVFEAVDGFHEASIKDEQISLRMGDVSHVEVHEDYVFLDTGSPHHVAIVTELETFDVYHKGKAIRNIRYGKRGANVNFVSPQSDNVFAVRTYERGVEDETLSCGTGVTAVALAMFETGKTQATHVTIETKGGQLKVRFKKDGTAYSEIWLEGPAKQVFKGFWK